MFLCVLSTLSGFWQNFVYATCLFQRYMVTIFVKNYYYYLSKIIFFSVLNVYNADHAPLREIILSLLFIILLYNLPGNLQICSGVFTNKGDPTVSVQ